MAEQITLEATRREVVGKKTKLLRAKGAVPGVLYGPEFESIVLQVPWADLRPALFKAGGSQIITLKVDGEEYNALVRSVQRAPLKDVVLHVDFYHVRMDVAIRTEVPIALVGDTTIIDAAGGQIVQEMISVEVECLPTNLPHAIQIDISGLEDVGDNMVAADLPDLEGVTYLCNRDDVVVSTSYLQRPEVEGEEGVEVGVGGEEPELIRRYEDEMDEDEV
ncbi:MAG: 50S ribosomal protein L25 [Anaerolineae bacterium]|nr:50S ribosomal protein L25 [Anaerolineae bacterium]